MNEVNDPASMLGWRAWSRFAWRNFFPSVDYMQHRYDIPHRLLALLYYPYRWWVGLRSVWRRGDRAPEPQQRLR